MNPSRKSRPLSLFCAQAIALLALSTRVLLVESVAIPQSSADKSAQVVERRLIEKKKAVDASVVTPCKTDVEAQVAQEETRAKNCGNCYTPTELEAHLQKLHRAGDHDLARCDIKGLDAQLAYISELEQTHLDQLRALASKFQGEVSAFESAASDAKKGHDEAMKKAEDVGLAYIAQEIVALSPRENADRIDAMLKRAEQLVDPRRVRSGELKDWVLGLRQQLTGKSKTQAKAIILNSLREAEDEALIDKQITGDLARSLPEDGNPPAEEAIRPVLDECYGTIMTGIEVAKVHGVKGALALGKATMLLAYAPDAIDTAELLYRSNVLETNVDGLEQLRAAAEEQRAIADTELKALVHQRQALEDQRRQFQEKTKQ